MKSPTPKPKLIVTLCSEKKLGSADNSMSCGAGPREMSLPKMEPCIYDELYQSQNEKGRTIMYLYSKGKDAEVYSEVA
jgi:hypothetical protein